MPTKPKDQVQEWLSAGFKSLVFCVFTMFTFFVSQLNTSISSLTVQLRSMEAHQVDSDKRIAAIEIARENTMGQYTQVVKDVAEMKTSLVQNTMRLQNLAEFVTKHFK